MAVVRWVIGGLEWLSARTLSLLDSAVRRELFGVPVFNWASMIGFALLYRPIYATNANVIPA